MVAESAHVTVLLDEAVKALVSDLDGRYVDGTFGRGGHARLILESLSEQGCLIGIDKDPEAVRVANELATEDGRFEIEHGSFARVKEYVDARSWDGATGILVDLGVSSPQLDDAGRGFSFQHDGPLDMRMDRTRGLSAAQWLQDVAEEELRQVIAQYGEERFARRIARAIVQERQQQQIVRTLQLAQLIERVSPTREKHKHPATRAFQGIRIKINRELGDLRDLLDSSLDMLKVGGRLVVISFHSLEDRMVKRHMRDMARGEQLPAGVPVMDSALNRRMKLVGKAVKASQEELGDNVRARSAIMRVAERTGVPE